MTRQLAELDRLDRVAPQVPLSPPAGARRRRRRHTGSGLRGTAILWLPVGLLVIGSLAVWGDHVPLSVLRVVQRVGDTPPIPAEARRDPLGTPPPAPAGEGGFRFMAHLPDRPDAPVAYDPCRPIHVVVNDAAAPPGADQILREAISRVSDATGLVFTLDGPTEELPSEDRPLQDEQYGDRWSPVLVAWTTPARVPELTGQVAGVGGSQRRKGPTSGMRYVTGSVSLDGPALREILQRPDGWPRARAIVMHELGHLVGLNHVPDPHQLMHETTTDQVTFGDGDLRGLHQLGLGQCYFDS